MAYSGKKYGKERGYCFVHGIWEQYLHLLRYLEYKTALFHKIDSFRSSREDILVNFVKLKQQIFRKAHINLGWFFFPNSSG